MADAVVRVVDVYVYRRQGGGFEYLLLRRASSKLYAGQWRMVGGKIEPGEPAWKTALRELDEETQLDPRAAWALPSVNAFYEPARDQVNLIPAFAAEVDADPVLDEEHDAFEWLPLSEAVARVAWPEQRRLLSLTDELLHAGPIPPDWSIRSLDA
ncbi:MAG: NUDIX pyrophosphatase [Bacteroidota bacterium]